METDNFTSTSFGDTQHKALDNSSQTLSARFKKIIRYDKISFWILCAVMFLLPVFVLPLATTSFFNIKYLLAYEGIALAFLFWLLDVFQSGEFAVPKSALLASLVPLNVVWFFSSLLSTHNKISFIGRGYENSVFFFVLACSVAMVLISILFSSEKRVLVFYASLFFGGLIAFLYQLFAFFKVNFLPLGGLLASPGSNLIGSWSDFGIFFGFMGLISLSLCDLSKFKTGAKIGLSIMAVISLLAMTAVNSLTVWIIFGFSLLLLLVYLFSKALFDKTESGVENTRRLIGFSFFVFLIVVVVVLSRGSIGEYLNGRGFTMPNTQQSWAGSFETVKNVFLKNPLLGAGPNIVSGLGQNSIGFLTSAFVFAGFFGGLAILAFMAIILFYGYKILSIVQDDLARTLAATSLIGSLYLWSAMIFSSPGFLISLLAFVVPVLTVTMLVHTGKIKSVKVSLYNNPKIGFVSVLVVTFLVIGSVSVMYLYAQKAFALRNYEQAIDIFKSESDIAKVDLAKVESKLLGAVRLDAWDEYYRALSELNLIRIQQIINDKTLAQSEAKSGFENALGLAIQNATVAKDFNSNDGMNWMQMGRIFESVVPLGITGADVKAVEAYQGASKAVPNDPGPLFASGRVKFQMKQYKEARGYLEAALKLKEDYAQAIFMLSQIAVQEGNLQEAIAKTERTAMLAPGDVGVLFQLGLLYYQAGNFDYSRLALERVVMLSPYYANARYFLGLIYDKKGLKEEAVKQFENIEQTNPDNQEIKLILQNLRGGKPALDGIGAPEKRTDLPVGDQKSNKLKKK